MWSMCVIRSNPRATRRARSINAHRDIRCCLNCFSIIANTPVFTNSIISNTKIVRETVALNIKNDCLVGPAQSK